MTLRKRQEGQTAPVRDISGRAQVRLHKKYIGRIMRGKGGGVAAAAVARELLGFAWAIACSVEAETRHASTPAAGAALVGLAVGTRPPPYP